VQLLHSPADKNLEEMPAIDFILPGVAAAAITVWAALSIHVLRIQRRRAAAETTLSAVLAALEVAQAENRPLDSRVSGLRSVLACASRELVMRAAADRTTPAHAVEPLEQYLVDRWGIDRVLADAASHRTRRDQWRRMTALKILFRMQHPHALTLLAAAVEDPDEAVARSAIAVLGTSSDREPAVLLVRALQSLRFTPATLAAQLEFSEAPVAGDLRSLLKDGNPVVRQYAAALLGRYVGERGLEQALLPLASDPDPRVRKAAIESLGTIGGDYAAGAAVALLADPVAYVRANAARAIASLGQIEHAAEVARLFADQDWWVRRAAKEALTQLGPDVWPVLVGMLRGSDRFARNGAAEVIQNLGLLDSLITMEAASDNPSPAKIDMLRHITEAGELRLTESLLQRAGPVLSPRLRQLLNRIGIDYVGAT
jgi:HEAT repeat protein